MQTDENLTIVSVLYKIFNALEIVRSSDLEHLMTFHLTSNLQPEHQ